MPYFQRQVNQWCCIDVFNKWPCFGEFGVLTKALLFFHWQIKTKRKWVGYIERKASEIVVQALKYYACCFICHFALFVL